MIAAMLCTEESPVVITSSYDKLDDPRLLELLEEKGITKFVGFTIPVELVASRYGSLYELAKENLRESDELRVIDDKNGRPFGLFSFKEMGPPMLYESPRIHEEAAA